VFDFVRQLGQYRKQSAALKTGKLMQFLPQNNVYAYARYTDAQTVMVFMNSGKKDATVETARFAERMKGYSRARNVLTGEVISNLTTLNVPAQTALLLELQR
jgi:glycosidase